MTGPGLPDGHDIDRGSLRTGRQLGCGGQGAVFELGSSHSGLVVKLYYRSDADGAALKRLVDLPRALSPQDQALLRRQAAWPLARVMNGTSVAGFVMRKIPDRFRGRTLAGSRERELSYLLFEPKPMFWGDISPPDIGGRIELVRQIAAIVHLLHSNVLIIGDVSTANLLWACDPAAAVFLIDCDGIRCLGRRPVHPQTETVDWKDPLPAKPSLDLDNDRYKCALIMGRILSRNPRVHPGAPLDLLPAIPERIAAGVQSLWQQAARARGLRPDVNQWLLALT
jgi:hypothetical protein